MKLSFASFIVPKILKRGRYVLAVSAMGALQPQPVSAHASEQGFVLLLPTDVYIGTGVASVALTVLLLALLPAQTAHKVFRPVRVSLLSRVRFCHLTSCLAAVMLAFLVWRGFTGTRDPLGNPLPLFIWTIWWVGLLSLQGLVGNHWRWTNPWTGPASVLSSLTAMRAPFRYPRGLGYWPSLAIFICFGVFLLADPAPADPARLAVIVGLYWYAMLFGVVLFGPAWLLRAEAITVLMRVYGRMGLFARRGRLVFLGFWGWQILTARAPPMALAIFILVLLGTGSFDGLNETFWWIGLLGLNPLEFPGRSVVVSQTIIGLFSANALLILAFALCVWLGERIAGSDKPVAQAFCLYAPSILPIALGYHVAHYLTSFMVDGQYALKMMNDPMGWGSSLLGLRDFYVTTGFFNTPSTVKAIWLTQAGAVVIGHVLAILLAHGIAVTRYGDNRRAILAQTPLALFMIAYTFFGLWLLASPRGL